MADYPKCPYPRPHQPEDSRWADATDAQFQRATPTHDADYRRTEQRLRALLVDDVTEGEARFVSDLLDGLERYRSLTAKQLAALGDLEVRVDGRSTRPKRQDGPRSRRYEGFR